VESGTVYELLDAGTSKGLFDVKAAANVSGSWVATGTYSKPAQPKVARLKPSKALPQFVHDAGSDDGKPHFAHRPPADSGSGQTSGQSGSGSASSAGGSSSSADSDRPTLHRRTDSTTGEQSGSGSSGSGSGSGTGSGTASNAPDVDPDRPTLHKRTDATANPNDNGAPVTATTNIDPDRPKLGYGKPAEYESLDAPSKVEIAKLAGQPNNLKLMAAVSDAKTREPHSYVYSWTDPEDAKKVQAALEDAAKNLLAGNAVTATVSGQTVATSASGAKAPLHKSTNTVTNSRTASAHAGTTHKKPAPKPALPDLEDEQFKAYELSFGGGATLVFSAKSGQGATGFQRGPADSVQAGDERAGAGCGSADAAGGCCRYGRGQSGRADL